MDFYSQPVLTVLLIGAARQGSLKILIFVKVHKTRFQRDIPSISALICLVFIVEFSARNLSSSLQLFIFGFFDGKAHTLLTSVEAV